MNLDVNMFLAKHYTDWKKSLHILFISEKCWFSILVILDNVGKFFFVADSNAVVNKIENLTV